MRECANEPGARAESIPVMNRRSVLTRKNGIIPQARDPIRIGVDTGGTFTDFVIWKDGKIFNKKILSTPLDPSEAIVRGVREIMDKGGEIFVIHGTTVATNALLENKGGRVALITTKGFEDVLAIGRQTRRDLYNLKGESRFGLVPRDLCFGAAERTSASGRAERRLLAGEVRKLVMEVRKSGVEAVAVCLIHSYINPCHERRIARALRRAGYLVSVSNEILPEYREYERTATTAINAILMPVMGRYLERLERKIGRVDLRIMQSNEGSISPQAARREPIRTALSGPAGGAVGASHLARTAGFKNIISFDMGGTSTDVSLIEGAIRRTHESRIGDFPLRIPIIDIHSVGAGGGSIAFADSGGSLRVGPRSAGADPGPACYGKGEFPTVTDADLLLGRLDPEFFLGGRMRILSERSRAAIRVLAKRIGKPLLETARGIVGVANANMEKAIRVISIERGYDPRDFALFSFGGAGGMHAAEIASRLQIPCVIVPKNAGVLSALGLLLANSVKDYVQSVLKPASETPSGDLERAFRKLEAAGRKDMKADGFEEDRIALQRFLDLRYMGQSYEITLSCPGSVLSQRSFLRGFHREHARLYSYHQPEREVEIVNLRIKAVASTEKIRLETRKETGENADKAIVKKQNIWSNGRARQGFVYDRSRLDPGMRIPGPALIVDPESTTFLPSGCAARVDGSLNLIVRKKAGAP